MRTVDLRSDTVTLPTPAMRRAMHEAEVGDDVYREDPTVNALEELGAAMLGKEAGLFVASGTMGNQVAAMAHTKKGDEIICEAEAHIYYYEVAALACLAGAQARPVAGDRGVLTVGLLRGAVRDRDVHAPDTGLICLENTHNRAGGTCYPLAELAAIPVLLVVTPAQHLAHVLSGLPAGPRDLVLCSKGIEAGTGRLMADVAAEAAPGATLAVLSGPTFAHEVAAGLPTAVTLACAGGEVQWERLAPAISRPSLRPYFSDDVTGAEIGGAVKNVLAIACGVVDGLGLGQNARAALIARGYAEMLRFGLARGARAETLAGLCGLGDLVLTCSSTSSRNFSLGKALGEGLSAAEALAGKNSVAEGAHTAPVLAELAAKAGLDLPIVTAVNRLLSGAAPARQVVAELLSRPLKAEGPGL